MRRLAGSRLECMAASQRSELRLAAMSLESLAFLIWRHLEHFLLYSSAALAATPATPYQVGMHGNGALRSEHKIILLIKGHQRHATLCGNFLG